MKVSYVLCMKSVEHEIVEKFYKDNNIKVNFASVIPKGFFAEIKIVKCVPRNNTEGVTENGN